MIAAAIMESPASISMIDKHAHDDAHDDQDDDGCVSDNRDNDDEVYTKDDDSDDNGDNNYDGDYDEGRCQHHIDDGDDESL